eukprot:gene926-932_t
MSGYKKRAAKFGNPYEYRNIADYADHFTRTKTMSIQKRKINPEDDLGFGPQPVIKNQPLVNKDGTPNVKRSMLGLLAFALATGLLYGRFSRPSAQIKFSENILIAPYMGNGKGVMFRLANLRRNLLIDLEIEIIFSFNELVDGKPVRRFYPLEVERKKVSVLTLNWTVVHPLDENSPLNQMTADDMEKSEAGFAILLRAFDDTFSQTVHTRTAYQHNDIIWGAKFKPVFDRDTDGRIVLDLSKISDHELVELI